ncbi:sigma-70 family RNA polymerase sigma factor, partial [candidate division KSB1 bacterium]|nr:sigma-70 family RNA polymerase sigma factor [candidate division KSB1 bacterium]
MNSSPVRGMLHVETLKQMIHDEQIETVIDSRSLRETLHDLLRKFNTRDQYILEMRYGLTDGREHTLEEIGQLLGITRERVRQLEARCLKQIKQSSALEKLQAFLTMDSRRAILTQNIQQRQQTRLLKVLDEDLFTYPIDDRVEIQRITGKIQKLIDKYVERARPREIYMRRGKSRRVIFMEILQELGKPVHYSLIHKMALDKLQGSDFPKERVYTILFYSDRYFRSYGNGVFGLASWDDQPSSEKDIKFFQYCPEPLLPANPFPTSFFESIMVGRDLLSRSTLTVKQFLDEMLRWANRREVSDPQAQLFFDAWYVAGFCERIRFPSDSEKTMTTLLPADAHLQEVRQYCLHALCQRVAKMPELLLALAR